MCTLYAYERFLKRLVDHIISSPERLSFVPGVKNTTIFSISFGSFDELEPF